MRSAAARQLADDLRLIYDAFMAAGGPEYMLELAHGYTYSVHPVACAAGVAALDLLVSERAAERVAESVETR